MTARQTNLYRLLGLMLAGALVASCSGTAPASTTASTSATAAAATATATPKPQVHMRVLLPFLNGMSFFAVSLADKLGYMKEEGITVDPQNPGESSDVVKGIIAGTGDVGLSLAPPILLGASQGYQVKVVSNWLYVRVHDVAVPSDSPVKTLKDLKGKAIAISDPNSGGKPLLDAELRDAGLDPNKDVTFVITTDDWGPKYAAYQAGKAQAMNVEQNNQAAAKAQGVTLRCLTCDNQARNSSEAWIVTPSYLQQNRAALAGFFRAQIKAMYFAKANPTATLALMKDVRPVEFATDKAIATTNVLFSYEIESFSGFPDGQHGLLDLKGWEDTKAFIIASSTNDPTAAKINVDINSLIDNSLVKEMNNFDINAVTTFAKNYKAP